MNEGRKNRLVLTRLELCLLGLLFIPGFLASLALMLVDLCLLVVSQSLISSTYCILPLLFSVVEGTSHLFQSRSNGPCPPLPNINSKVRKLVGACRTFWYAKSRNSSLQFQSLPVSANFLQHRLQSLIKPFLKAFRLSLIG